MNKLTASTLSKNTLAIPYAEYVSVPVVVPRIEMVPVRVEIPWIVKDNSTSIVLWPQIKSEPVQVYVPQTNNENDEIYYFCETWAQDVITQRLVKLRGRVKYHKTAIWFQRRIIYEMGEMIQKKDFNATYVEFPKTRISVWERASMAILGGKYEDVQEVNISHSNGKPLSEQVNVRSGLRAEFKGISGILPAFNGNLQIGNNATSK